MRNLIAQQTASATGNWEKIAEHDIMPIGKPAWSNAIGKSNWGWIRLSQDRPGTTAIQSAAERRLPSSRIYFSF